MANRSRRLIRSRAAAACDDDTAGVIWSEF